MTGFAALTRGDVTLTVKALNHKSLDLHFQMPVAFEAAEPQLRQLVRASVARGSVQIRVSWAPQAATGLNRELLQTWLRTFQEAAAELHITAEPDLNAALRLPGMVGPLSTPSEVPDPAPLLEEALIVFNEFREREGAAIGIELLERANGVENIAAEIARLRNGASAAFHNRLLQRIQEIVSAPLDPQRLAQEAAFLVEKSDVSEELVRLRTHAAQLKSLLGAEGEIGKKLDFLLQEMNREANTILSKTGGLADIGLQITDLALQAKSEIDKIREQALNLE
ncbi:MAG: YicC family protein [Acidobacteriota bacterium]|nr:YicC family protein [Acidobacteriota bacterium]